MEVDGIPEVTVVIPVLDCERWIEACVESICTQTFQDFEIFVIDDGCSDRTIEIVRGMGVDSLQVIPGPRRGAGAARALGICASSSPFIATQDGDDLSDPYRLEKQLEYMYRNPACVVVGSWARNISESGARKRIIKVPRSSRSLKFALNLGSPFIHSSTLLRREAVLQAGNYPAGATTVYADDYDLWSRMAPLGEFYNIQEPLVSYRTNGQGVTGMRGQILRQQASLIATRNTETFLEERLCDSDRILLGLVFHRYRRMRIGEALRLYKLRIRLLRKAGFPPPVRGITYRSWFAPFVWVAKKQ